MRERPEVTVGLVLEGKCFPFGEELSRRRKDMGKGTEDASIRKLKLYVMKIEGL